MSNGLRRKDMRKVQKWGVDHIYDNEATILAWDMGAGKSVTVLTAMDDLLEDGVVKRVLIVAPLLVAQATIPDEFDDWAHLNHVEYTLLRVEDDDPGLIKAHREALELAAMLGIPSKSEAAVYADMEKQRCIDKGITDKKELADIRKDAMLDAVEFDGLSTENRTSWAQKKKTKIKEWMRGRLAEDGAEVHIIDKGSLPWLWEYFGKGKRWPYDMIIVDEASMFKNGTKRTKMKSISQFGAAAKARKYAKRVVLMTGTPAPKGLENLWGLAYIADLGERLGSEKHFFKRRWFTEDYMGFNNEPKPHAFAQITEKLSDIMFTLAPEDYPDLPGSLYKPIKVRLSNKVMDEYDRFEKSLFSEMYDVEAVNKGVLVGKLLQFANGSMYNDDRDDVWIHDEKLAALEEIYDRAAGDPVLVAYSYQFDLKRIKRVFKKAEIFGQGDVRRMKERWNAGEIKMMLAHPAAVGHGQNIQFGGHINCWYGLTPDLELYQQFNKRLDRPGQTRRVSNYHILAKGTYDEKIIPLLGDKGQTQDSIMKAFRIDMNRMYG